ncbi:putative RNA helicase [Cyclospora cayetanensis]|uniref:RNA helicase n=1 Tax=Cyclospora cayetanensis TaxID=88456 RepID=A0A1D3CT02_9EIME|nr:putative RNA helicase [Cyclospora cayetanensis]
MRGFKDAATFEPFAAHVWERCRSSAQIADSSLPLVRKVCQTKPLSTNAIPVRAQKVLLAYSPPRALPWRSAQSSTLGSVSLLPFSYTIGCAVHRTISGLSAARVSALPISFQLQEGLQRLRFRNLTEVQRFCLLRALGGTSLVVAARPGTGKTVAYLLPVLQRFVAENERQNGVDNTHAPTPRPFALIVVPSRELAKQVTNVAVALLPHAPVLLLDPTASLRHQQQLLRHLPAKIIVGTPDRILSLLREKRPATHTASAAGESTQLSLDMLRVLVVDEADALLRRDYHSKVQRIYWTAMGWEKGKERPPEGTRGIQRNGGDLQVLFFSAVLPSNLMASFKADFPQAELLNLLDSSKDLPRGGLTANGVSAAESHEAESTSVGHTPGSAVAGVGVQRHVCYLPPRTAPGTLDDSLIQNDSILGGEGRSRRQKSQEETHIEKERKMLALAETLRTHLLPSPRPSSASSTEVQVKSTAAETSPQCIVFADSQDEVRYIKNHPLLDAWRVVAIHSNMDAVDRQHSMQTFAEGDASVLVSTDVVARGLDIPSVALVVHMHPPTPPVNYTHRTGRAGRGTIPGTSVVLCSSLELRNLREVERLGDICFERRALPAVADCQELALRQITADMLGVPPTQYAPLLDLARRLHEKSGVQALAATLAKLGSLLYVQNIKHVMEPSTRAASLKVLLCISKP